ncbi:MAG: sulfotransferase family 2 domain-containing protein [Deltaproteobacteria bacterium]|nr:sulfotransferase family 2 domain-containing protein [Deltaproteobacteria bacterium]
MQPIIFLQNFLPKHVNRRADRIRLTALETFLHFFWPRHMRIRTDRILMEDHRAIYFAIPKVACTSLKFLVAEAMGREVTGNVHFHKFPKVYDLKKTHYSEYFKFCFVRNPFDRVLSCYLHKFKQGKDREEGFVKKGVYLPFAEYGLFHPGTSFGEFVKGISEIDDNDADAHFRSQHAFIRDGQRDIPMDFIGRLETLGPDVSHIAEKLGFPDVPLHHMEKTDHAGYRQYYTADTRKLVARRYGEDLERFGYSF